MWVLAIQLASVELLVYRYKFSTFVDLYPIKQQILMLCTCISRWWPAIVAGKFDYMHKPTIIDNCLKICKYQPVLLFHSFYHSNPQNLWFYRLLPYRGQTNYDSWSSAIIAGEFHYIYKPAIIAKIKLHKLRSML